MKSPILELRDHIVSAPFQVAPEARDELKAWVDETKFHVTFNREMGFGIRVYPETAECILPIAALEFLWACTYAFLVFFDEYTQDQRAYLNKFDMTANSHRRGAWDLMQWALENVLHSGTEQWPDKFPKPRMSADMTNHVRVADELFLVALAWIIHHEIAHVRGKHAGRKTVYSLEQEKEADREATRWILSKSPSQGHSVKRTLGIATAILTLQTLQEPGSSLGFRTHPKAFERLYSCLEGSGVGATDQVYAFAVVLIQILGASYGIEADIHGETFQDILHGMLVQMARYNKP